MHIIVERMIPFPEDDARIQGLKVRAETYACEKNIVKSEIIFIHMHMSWMYVYIYFVQSIVHFYVLYKRFPGIIFFHEILTALCLFSIVYFFFLFIISFVLFFFSDTNASFIWLSILPSRTMCFIEP